MRKPLIILAFLAVFALVSAVSAVGPIQFSQSGEIVVTFVSSSASYNNQFGLELPTHQYLGTNNVDPDGTVYQTGQTCVAGQPVAVYMYTPEGHTYRSDVLAGDTFDHALVIPELDHSFTVQFENIWGSSSDKDYNDVVLNVACIPSTPAPEFPTLALPAGLIVGLLGVVLFIRKTEE